jgi:hypothetical protein
MQHLARPSLEAGLDHIRRSPRHEGRLELIVRRPAENEREMLEEATLDCAEGLVGDTWRARGSRHTPDGSALPEQQITVMNLRVAALVAVEPDRRQLCGDQLYVDLDLSQDNLPPGTRLSLGSAVIEIAAKPHLGCWKFDARFGTDALRFVNSAVGRELRLRGLNARVVTGGTVRVGDTVRKV